MSFSTRKIFRQPSRGSKINSPEGMLPRLRADIFRQLGFYGTFCGLVLCALVYCGSTRAVLAAGPERVGLPWDWSHEHVVFSKTDDPAVMAIITKDARAYHQWLRKNPTASRRAAESVSVSAPAKSSQKSDWGFSLGATQFNPIGTSAPLYPAKYSFDLNALPDCLNDYVAFATGALGKKSPSGQASIVGLNQLYSSQGGTLGLCGNAGPEVAWAYINAACPAMTSNDPILSSPVISPDGTKIAWVTTTGKVQILTWGVGITSGGAESVTNPACIGSSGVGGDGSTLLSFTLKNAKHTGPSVTFSQVFVDYDSDSAYVGDDDGYLHKISPFFKAVGSLNEIAASTWQASHAYSVGTLIVDSNGFIEKCTTAGTSKSGPHPGWGSSWGGTTTDHTVTWTNLGSGGAWPVYVTGSSSAIDNSPLNAPILDVVSRNLFVGDQNGSLYYVLDPGVSIAVGSCANGISAYPCLGLPGTATPITPADNAQSDCATASPGPTCLVMSNQEGFTDGLVVDISRGLVITQFSNADGAVAAVEQTDTSLSVFNSATLTSNPNSIAHHSGAFDIDYYNDPTTGYYYVCGPAADGVETDLYRVGFTNSGTVALGSKNGNPVKLSTNGNSPNCGPITEVYNSNSTPVHDWLFVSLDNHGLGHSSNDGPCVKEIDLGSTMPGNPVRGIHAGYGSGTPGDIVGMNGTGGMIVDNISTKPQASSIYFAPVSNGITCGDGTSGTGCSVKLTQANLK